jgi:hypothetical protein
MACCLLLLLFALIALLVSLPVLAPLRLGRALAALIRSRRRRSADTIPDGGSMEHHNGHGHE